MKIEDLHRTRIDIDFPEGHRVGMPWPKDAIRIDGHPVGSHVNITIHHEINDFMKVTISGDRPLYPTDVYANGTIMATDHGRLWDMRALVLKGVSGA